MSDKTEWIVDRGELGFETVRAVNFYIEDGAAAFHSEGLVIAYAAGQWVTVTRGED